MGRPDSSSLHGGSSVSSADAMDATIWEYVKPTEEVLSARRQHYGPNASLNYAQPLHMVRGQGAHRIAHAPTNAQNQF